jgi:hypothetical protein
MFGQAWPPLECVTARSDCRDPSWPYIPMNAATGHTQDAHCLQGLEIEGVCSLHDMVRDCGRPCYREILMPLVAKVSNSSAGRVAQFVSLSA